MKKSVYLQSLLVFCFILCSAAVKASVPVITVAPRDTITCQGDTAAFFITATSTSAITYSWQVSSDGGTTWTLITKDTLFYSGHATDSLVVIGDASINGNVFRAIATNTDGADTVGFATLTVRQLPDPGTIIGDDSVCKGSSTTLSDASLGGVWSSSATAIATIGTGGTVSGIAQGFATITYKVTNMCGAQFATLRERVDTTVVGLPITGPTSVCKAGAPVNLMNGNTLGLWSWNPSNGDVSISHAGVLVGVHGGSASIVYVFTNSCNSVNTNVIVTVDTVLSHGVITGPSAVCTGSWIHLSDAVSGGFWISDNTAIADVDGIGNVTGVSQGSDVISYYLANACGASVATDTITVYSPASMITGIDSVGVGHTRTLADTATGGMWTSSDTSKATIDTFSGVATGVAVGTTIITYTVTNICGTTTALLTLYVGNAPDPGKIFGGPGFDSAVCIGSTVALFDTAKGGFGTWSTLHDSIATVNDTGVVTGVETLFNTHSDSLFYTHVGIDTVVYTFTNAFGTSKAMIPIIVNQAPAVGVTGPAIIAYGGNYFFGGTPYYDWIHTPSTIYLPLSFSVTNVGVWTQSNPAVGTIVAVIDSSGDNLESFCSLVVLGGGTDVMTYTVHNTCGSTSATDTISLTIAPVSGVTPLQGDVASITVYPNPTDGVFNIKLLSQVTEEANVIITNVTGQKVSEMTITTNKNYNIKLDQPAGLYLLSATTPTGKYDAKITIAK